MSVLAQGTNIYFINPLSTVPEVVQVECATTFSPGGNPADQIEDTCLENNVRSYQPGLRTPGQASMTLNADPDNASHLLLQQMAETDPPPTVAFAVGWSDGTAPPTLDSADAFELPTTRTWFTFSGYVSDFPFDFAQNTVVTTSLTIQRSGGSQWIPKI